MNTPGSPGFSRIENNRSKVSKDELLIKIESQMKKYQNSINNNSISNKKGVKLKHRHSQQLWETIASNFNKLTPENKQKLSNLVNSKETWNPLRWIGKIFPNSKYSRRKSKKQDIY